MAQFCHCQLVYLQITKHAHGFSCSVCGVEQEARDGFKLELFVLVSRVDVSAHQLSHASWCDSACTV
jgi:hypothetical protein